LPGTGESTVNGLSLVLGVLLGGSLVFLVFAILSRRDREKPRRGAGAGGLPGAGGDGGTSSGGTAG
jgi:LPXTG-motif cell wall-anchored protein